MTDFRIGHGYDVHRLTKDRALILGGVNIPYSLGLLGHSDADVLLHAVMDSLLGAAGLGDIGTHFPDTDDQYRDICSLKLYEHVIFLLKEQGFSIGNIDVTVIAQKPKLLPYIAEMRKNIAVTSNISIEQINVKATTTEQLGFCGRGEGIACHAVSLIYR